MQFIHDGLKYDTEKSQKLGHFISFTGGRGGDFTNEMLFKSKSADDGYFVVKTLGYKAQEKLLSKRAMTEAEAKSWAELHLSVGEYEKIFGPVKEA